MAGCSDPSPPADVPVPSGAPSAMSIVGLVQDEAFNPVAGANVTLRLMGRSAATDASGGFRFDGLAPSAYLVDVNATGLEPASLTAEPQPGGANASLNFVLLQLPSLRPRATAEHFRGTYECPFEAAIIPGSCDILLEEAGQSPFEDL